MKKTSLFKVSIATFSVVLFMSFTSTVQAKNDPTQEEIAITEAVKIYPLNSAEHMNSAEKQANALTYKNMQEAFKGETTASAKYAAYSKKAEEEGYHEIALMFKATSTSESIHANNHKVVLQAGSQTVPTVTPEFTVKSTLENLKDALAGETYEITTMYPEFIDNSVAAGNQSATISLTYALKTEKKHKALYENAIAALENNKVNKSVASVYFVCPVCGNTYANATPENCEISGTPSVLFKKIETLQ
ncbi:MAG: rubrerythrin family protein [Bacteroidales bacterium]|nr:rubrerythrin family protein [Bacteroidales bacterium]